LIIQERAWKKTKTNWTRAKKMRSENPDSTNLNYGQALKSQFTLWNDVLSTIFPRNEVDLSKLPTWACADDAVLIQIEASIQELDRIPQLKDQVSKEIPKRLLYSLSVTTFSR
jgi:hypothetical protein